MHLTLLFWLALIIVGILSGFVAKAISKLRWVDDEHLVPIFLYAFLSAAPLATAGGASFNWWAITLPVRIGLLIVAPIFSVALATHVADIKPNSAAPLLCALWMVFCLGASIIYFVLQLPLAITELERRSGGPLFRWEMVAIVLIAGLGAHVFKRVNQMAYGFTEVIFGATTMYRLAAAWPRGGTFSAQWVAMAGAAYIVARGLNNCHDARITAVENR
jgi:hypothetical protein